MKRGFPLNSRYNNDGEDGATKKVKSGGFFQDPDKKKFTDFSR